MNVTVRKVSNALRALTWRFSSGKSPAARQQASVFHSSSHKYAAKHQRLRTSMRDDAPRIQHILRAITPYYFHGYSIANPQHARVSDTRIQWLQCQVLALLRFENSGRSIGKLWSCREWTTVYIGTDGEWHCGREMVYCTTARLSHAPLTLTQVRHTGFPL